MDEGATPRFAAQWTKAQRLASPRNGRRRDASHRFAAQWTKAHGSARYEGAFHTSPEASNGGASKMLRAARSSLEQPPWIRRS